MSGSLLQFVNEFKYLGHCITDTLKDDDDIKREIRNMYIRTNMLYADSVIVHLMLNCACSGATVFAYMV